MNDIEERALANQNLRDGGKGHGGPTVTGHVGLQRGGVVGAEPLYGLFGPHVAG